MSKDKIIKFLIAGTVFFSVLAAFIIYRYMAPSRGTIYTFNDSYSAGTQLTSDMLSPVQVDASVIVAGKNSDLESQFVTPSGYVDIVKSGDSLRMDVSEGMPLTTAMLSVAGGSSVEMNMRSDAIAVTIPVDQYTGITNELKSGARVNIYTSSDAQTKMIQQNKRILEVYYDEGVITGVSVEEDVNESMELIYAATYGKIYLGLVDSTGYQAKEGEDPIYNAYTSTTDINTDASTSETEITNESETSNETNSSEDFTLSDEAENNSEPADE